MDLRRRLPKTSFAVRQFVFVEILGFQNSRRCCYREKGFLIADEEEQILRFEESEEKGNQEKLLGCERGYWRID